MTSTEPKGKWGGKRDNQTGRPPIRNGKRVNRAISLTEHRLDFMLSKYGDRKLSAGVRRLIDLDERASVIGVDLEDLLMAAESSLLESRL